ncbi:hypothetical protein FPSM_01546 [Flavobacterium psychrophilum]|nr:hypothetical protein FPSM_01546 [Flavobacterium psychrophilum]
MNQLKPKIHHLYYFYLKLILLFATIFLFFKGKNKKDFRCNQG